MRQNTPTAARSETGKTVTTTVLLTVCQLTGAGDHEDGMMDTPILPPASHFQHVYEPAEDTFLLMDAIEQDLPAIKKIRYTLFGCCVMLQ